MASGFILKCNLIDTDRAVKLWLSLQEQLQQTSGRRIKLFLLITKFPFRILNLSYPEQTIRLNMLSTVSRHKRFKKEIVFSMCAHSRTERA